MPRKCNINPEDVIKALRNEIKLFSSSELPKSSDEVWGRIRRQLNNLWTQPALILAIKRDWRQVLTKARQLENIVIEETQNTDQNLNSTNVEEDSEEDLEGDSADLGTITCKPWPEKFEIILSPDILNEQCKVQGGKKYTVLSDNWTDDISEAVYIQTRLPCAFTFKSAKVYKSNSRTHYVKINGKCKSKKCGNIFFGYITEEPQDGEEVLLHCYCRNTLHDEHEDIRRQLRGNKRKIAVNQAIAQGTSKMLQAMAANIRMPGDSVCPIIPKASTVRTAITNRNNCAVEEKKCDIVTSLESLAFGHCYGSSIQAMSIKPFFVFYQTTQQLQNYRVYARLNPGKIKIEINATDSLMQKIPRNKSPVKSGNIFLFSMVINCLNKLLHVNQMISESHTSELIGYWIQQWINGNGLEKPNECVIDYSKALLLSTCLSFNQISIKMYLEKCFRILRYNKKTKMNMNTYVRIDVAHLMNLVCRWTCVQAMKRTGVKDFYLRCLSLLVDCETFIQFETILNNILLVAFNPYDDSEEHSVKKARQYLENLIANRTDCSQQEWTNIMTYSKVIMINEYEDDTSSPEDDDQEEISQWLENLKLMTKITYTDNMQGDINVFYNEDFGEMVLELCKHFPLWTATMNSFFNCHNLHALSASIEDSFGALKKSIKQRYSQHPRADTFLRFHLENIKEGPFIIDGQITQDKCTNGQVKPECHIYNKMNDVYQTHGKSLDTKGREAVQEDIQEEFNNIFGKLEQLPIHEPQPVRRYEPTPPPYVATPIPTAPKVEVLKIEYLPFRATPIAEPADTTWKNLRIGLQPLSIEEYQQRTDKNKPKPQPQPPITKKTDKRRKSVHKKENISVVIV